MLLNNVLIIGEQIDIDINGVIAYKSFVEDIPDDETVIVSHPMHKQLFVRINPDASIRIIFYRPNGMYFFEAELVGTFEEQSARLMTFRSTSEVDRLQRRRGFRLDISIPVKVKILDEETDEYFEINCNTANISECGMLLDMDINIETGSIVTLKFQIDGQTLEIMAEVIRIIESEEKKRAYYLGVAFLDIKRWMQKIIAKFLLDEQIRRRARS